VPTSPHPLTPSGLCRQRVLCVATAIGGQVIRAGHAIIHERAGEELAAHRVIDTVLAERLADALHDAAMDLALDDHRVQHYADIVDRGVSNEIQLAGIRIDLDLGDMTAAGKGEIHGIEEGGLFQARLQDVERKAVRRKIGGPAPRKMPR
jgi:hypothetical protein